MLTDRYDGPPDSSERSDFHIIGRVAQRVPSMLWPSFEAMVTNWPFAESTALP